ncbi:MAG: redoxin family protein [Bacteroidales bacterium]
MLKKRSVYGAIFVLIALCFSSYFHFTIRFFNINGKINKIPDSTLVYLNSGHLEFGKKTLDSCFTKEGRFSLSAAVNFPQKVFLEIPSKSYIKEIFVNKGADIELHGDNVGTLKITKGIKEQRKYEKYKELCNKLRLLKNELNACDFCSFGLLLDSIERKKQYSQVLLVEELINSFLHKNQSSCIYLEFLEEKYDQVILGEYKVEQFDSLLSELRYPYNQIEWVHNMHNALKQQRFSSIGHPAIDIPIFLKGHKHKKLSDYKGKPILLSFFEPSCPKCVFQYNQMKFFYAEVKSHAFEFISVYADNNLQSMLSDTSRYNPYWPICSTTDSDGEFHKEALDLYCVDKFPCNILIDTSFKIIDRNRSFEQMKTKLCQEIGIDCPENLPIRLVTNDDLEDQLWDMY